MQTMPRLPRPRFATGAVIAAALVLLAACATVPPAPDAAADRAPVDLERFFAGRTSGTGVFESGIAGVERRFAVTTRGRLDGDTFVLVEDFAFDDGERDRKTWRFERAGEGKWIGRREDIVGTADVRRDGAVVRLSYDADVRGEDGGVTRLHFEDVLIQRDRRSVENRAIVSKFGVPVGTVEVTFVRRR